MDKRLYNALFARFTSKYKTKNATSEKFVSDMVRKELDKLFEDGNAGLDQKSLVEFDRKLRSVIQIQTMKKNQRSQRSPQPQRQAQSQLLRQQKRTQSASEYSASTGNRGSHMENYQSPKKQNDILTATRMSVLGDDKRFQPFATFQAESGFSKRSGSHCANRPGPGVNSIIQGAPSDYVTRTSLERYPRGQSPIVLKPVQRFKSPIQVVRDKHVNQLKLKREDVWNKLTQNNHQNYQKEIEYLQQRKKREQDFIHDQLSRQVKDKDQATTGVQNKDQQFSKTLLAENEKWIQNDKQKKIELRDKLKQVN